MIKLVSSEAKELVNLLKAYSKIVPNPTVEFRQEGMRIIGLDKNQAALGCIYFSNEHLEEFGRYEVEKEVGVSLDLGFIQDIPVYSKDVLELEVVNVSSAYCTVILRISGKSKRVYSQEALVFEDGGSTKIPNIEYKSFAVVDYSLFADSVKAFKGVSKTVKIATEDGKVVFEGRGKIDTLKVELEAHGGDGRAVAAFDLRYLLKMLRVFEAYGVREIRLYLNTNRPLKLMGPLKRGSGYIEFYLAPLDPEVVKY